VLGRELQLRSQASPDHVREVEAFVNSIIAEAAESTKGGDLQILAIVALMNLAEGHLSLSQAHEELKQQQKELALSLIEKIDKCSSI
jgi:cell division protein ZapA